MSDFETATLAGGCFWCVEAVYADLKGVESATSGYAGGAVDDPTYEQVCTGTTGHAEVVQIRFDPAVISFADVLEVFWNVHEPTTLNRQGADVGTQYRSAIFYHDEKQREVAEASKREAQKDFSSPIVTEISPMTTFHPAEGYHQDYFKLNPNQPYCRAVVSPKVQKFRKQYQERLKTP